MQRVNVLSSPSSAGLELSPSFIEQDSSPSSAGFESESKSTCLWLESKSESQGADISQLSYKDIFHNTIDDIIICLQVVSICIYSFTQNEQPTMLWIQHLKFFHE